MAGLIVNDQVEVYHMLCPSVKARGRITRAHQLDCTVEVVEGEEKRKLVDVLDAVYRVSLCQLLSMFAFCCQ